MRQTIGSLRHLKELTQYPALLSRAFTESPGEELRFDLLRQAFLDVLEEPALPQDMSPRDRLLQLIEAGEFGAAQAYAELRVVDPAETRELLARQAKCCQ